jgi:hypothetical protein
LRISRRYCFRKCRSTPSLCHASVVLVTFLRDPISRTSYDEKRGRITLPGGAQG